MSTDGNDFEFDFGDTYVGVGESEIDSPLSVSEPITIEKEVPTVSEQIQEIQEQPIVVQPKQTIPKSPKKSEKQVGLPDPNHIVQKPIRTGNRGYSEKSGGVSPTQKNIQPIQRPMNDGNIGQQQPIVEQPPNNMQFMTQEEHNETHQMQPVQQKKKSKLPLIIILVVLVIGGIIGSLFIYKQSIPVPQDVDYTISGQVAYNNLLSALNNYDATLIDSYVGKESGDSYLAQEWAYINGVSHREKFIKKMCSLIRFEYPMIQQLSTKGEPMYDSEGNPIMIESPMNNGETVTVTIPDYDKLSLEMKEDKKYISKLFSSSKYTEDSYTWYEDMANLMLQYINEKDTIPTKTIELSLIVGINTDGTYYIVDDSLLDDALFGSDAFHNCCATFSQICMGWTGYKDEVYYEKEEQPNPEFEEWNKLFTQYYEEDNGVFNKWTSKWEPFYLRDENNNYVYDENGNKIVDYYTVKREDGTDWVQPDETILVDVEKVRQIEDPWIEETCILYNWIGTHYIQTDYDGIGDTIVRVGDGTRERPAGIGTSIITKVKCTDGTFRDIKVSLLGYWTGQDAIDYAERFSIKNRGFTTESVVKLITFEVKIENLEDIPIKFTSEMTLTDKNNNLSSRTGTLYGFTEEVTLGAGESVIINDWATSTELDQKYVCWGKSFGRNYEMVFFNVLAGTGNIPPYSAYEQFNGQSNIEE